MRLIVARCEVRYSGRLSAVLPEALRLIMVKSDGSVMVHADHGGYKPSNWMTPPTVIEEGGDRIVVRKRAGATEDRLDILIAEVLSDVTHDMGEAAALEKDGVEADLQQALADAPEWCGEGFRLVRREWPMYEARDLGLLVRMANHAVANSGRTVDWVHMAGPRYLRSEDESYFRPLSDLQAGDARVFLGIVLPIDGAAGLERRHRTASRFLADFGVAMYCGFGRQPGADGMETMREHARVVSTVRG